jgi:hypothetical protein
MIKSVAKTSALESIGEDIGQELGAKMVKDFQDLHPTENQWIFIGRNILGKILDQPDCAGIRFYHALNEFGQKTCVYVGVDSNENIIVEYTMVNEDGQIRHVPAIVADRAGNPDGTKTKTTSIGLPSSWISFT